MEIKVAQTAGFCFGVKRAVNLAFEAEAKASIYTYGPIIHNDTIIQRLEAKGITAIDTIQDKNIDTLIIRAHGVGKALYEAAEARSIELIDATCPYVSKIHKLVNKYQKEGYEIILIGDAKHPEIIGINGWAHDACLIIKDLEDLKHHTLDQTKHYLIVSQTTYKKEVVEEVVNYLEEKEYFFTYKPTICNATKERQEEAYEMAQQMDTMLVIGSTFSSNTQKLYEICQRVCPQTYCILDQDDLTKEMIANTQKIGITAGASTPHDIIEAVVEKVKQLNLK